MAGLRANNGRKWVIHLKQSLQAWGSEVFESVFKQELEQLPIESLPLLACLEHSSAVADEPFRVVLLGAERRHQGLEVRAGIFYSGIIAGCSCADDPTPPELQQEYCELEFEIEDATAATIVRLSVAW